MLSSVLQIASKIIVEYNLMMNDKHSSYVLYFYRFLTRIFKKSENTPISQMPMLWCILYVPEILINKFKKKQDIINNTLINVISDKLKVTKLFFLRNIETWVNTTPPKNESQIVCKSSKAIGLAK